MYDPVTSDTIAINQPYPSSYWADTVGQLPAKRQLTTSIQTDTLIIGGGYAGLSCAYHLAKNYGEKATLIEANGIGYGCSGRNAGFVLPLSGRLGYEALVKRFGFDKAKLIHQEFIDGVNLVETLINTSKADVNQVPAGYLKIAHRPKYYDKLRYHADYMAKHFDYKVTPISKHDLRNDYLDHHQAHGALLYQQGYGIHPFKLCLSLYEMATALGCDIYNHTPALNIEYDGKYHIVTTHNGQIKAKNLVLCTNGYTPSKMHRAIDKRFLPVQTSVIVTRPLTEQEITNSHYHSNQVMMDTRELKYYYRKLPDNRILFGGRGAITGKQALSGKYHQRLLQGLKQALPALSEVTIDYQWDGWINVSLDEVPHIYQADNQVFYSGGYCGAGLSFSLQAGKRLAQKVAGDSQSHQIPMLQTPLPKFPFSPFRRVGQGLFYQWGRFKDAWV